jgi:hypothetical protein
MEPLTRDLTDVLTSACNLMDAGIFHLADPPILCNQVV